MKNWYCVYTKAGQSDNVCKRLQMLPDIEVFNPKLKRKKFQRGKWVETTEDFFPCYIFLKLELDRYYRIVKYTRGVRRFVGDTTGRPYTVDEDIIQKIKARMENGFVKTLTRALNPGDRVVIRDGVFAGFEGVFLEELKPSERVIILLNTIQRARVIIDRTALLYKE